MKTNLNTVLVKVACLALMGGAAVMLGQTTHSITMDATSGANYPGTYCTGNIPGTSTPRPSPICIESLQAAVQAAYADIDVAGHHNDTWNIYLTSLATDPVFDLTAQTHQLYPSVSGTYPTYNGLIDVSNSPGSTLYPIGIGRINIIGSSASGDYATLKTDGSFITVFGANVQNVQVSYIKFFQNKKMMTQGTASSPGNQTVSGAVIWTPSPGYEDPITFINRQNLYRATAAHPTTPKPKGTFGYIRAYFPAESGTNGGYPELVDETGNAQIPYNSATDASDPSNMIPNHVKNNGDGTYTMWFTGGTGVSLPTSYTENDPNGHQALLCMKYEGSWDAYRFDDTNNGNTDTTGVAGANVGFDHVYWYDMARGAWTNITGPFVTNSNILQQSEYDSSSPSDCISTATGGPQFGQPGSNPITFNADGEWTDSSGRSGGINMNVNVNGLTTVNTGDDTIAIFNDNNGWAYTFGSGSTIKNTTIQGSFARDINLDFSCYVGVPMPQDTSHAGVNTVSNCFSTNLNSRGTNVNTDNYPSYYGACVSDTSGSGVTVTSPCALPNYPNYNVPNGPEL